ncbi:MAG: RT0821/Lpp0805 family surface protein [Geminicoccaceae bacterium]|nr:RT0821/Lpp0805 family surface protein [Geminicoccaceae bacterium]
MSSRIFRPWSIGPALAGALTAGVPQGHAAAVDPSGDLEHVRPLLEQTLETEKSGIEIRWSNPGTGHSGKIRVERTFFRDDQPCRDYLRTVTRPGESGFVIRGTACRTGRAVWTIGDENVVETDPPKKRAARTTSPAMPPPPVEAAATDREPRPAPSAGEAPESARAEIEPPAAAPKTTPADEPFVSFTLPSRSPL